MRKLVMVIIFPFIASCAATFPDACSLEKSGDSRAWECGCKVLTVKAVKHPDGKPAPAGMVEWLCDGKKIPISAITDNIGLPKCQE